MAVLDAQRVDDARRSAEEAAESARALAEGAVESARSYKRNVEGLCVEYARAPSEPLRDLALARLAHWATKEQGRASRDARPSPASERWRGQVLSE